MKLLSAVSIAAALAALFATGPAQAQDGIDPAKAAAFDKKIFAGPIGDQASACFVRRYDARHLAQHPKQKVAAMKLLVTAENHPGEPTNYAYKVGVQFRNKRGDFDGGSPCDHFVVEESGNEIRFSCDIECGGAGLEIAAAKGDKSIIVRLEAISVYDRKHPDGDPTPLEGGADDKVFRLDRVDTRECDDLPKNHDEMAELNK